MCLYGLQIQASFWYYSFPSFYSYTNLTTDSVLQAVRKSGPSLAYYLYATDMGHNHLPRIHDRILPVIGIVCIIDAPSSSDWNRRTVDMVCAGRAEAIK